MLPSGSHAVRVCMGVRTSVCVCLRLYYLLVTVPNWRVLAVPTVQEAALGCWKCAKHEIIQQIPTSVYCNLFWENNTYIIREKERHR